MAHTILSPAGQEIELPAFAIGQLRRMGLLFKNRQREGRMQISPLYLELARVSRPAMINIQPKRMSSSRISGGGSRNRDGTIGGLVSILGPDASGPSVAVCSCDRCTEGE